MRGGDSPGLTPRVSSGGRRAQFPRGPLGRTVALRMRAGAGQGCPGRRGRRRVRAQGPEESFSELQQSLREAALRPPPGKAGAPADPARPRPRVRGV